MKIVILDRDGVINYDSNAYIKSVDEWRPIPGSIAAIASLHQQGFRIFVATNQSGVARGLFTLAALDAMHAKMHALVQDAGGKIEHVVFCPHGPQDNCGCRKPLSGLLDQIESFSGSSLQGAPCIGDSLRDIQAARAKGCEAMLVLTGKGRDTLATLQDDDLQVFPDLAAAAEFIVRRE